MNESDWEIKYRTLSQANRAVIDRIREFKSNVGARERSDGTIEIDYDKFLSHIGVEGWLELRRLGDEKFRVSGIVGEKPKVRVAS